ncbi:MAG: AbrB/MazE/SpoVT family DNA-binding domain-containing protein [Candidatus Binatia bacterium]
MVRGGVRPTGFPGTDELPDHILGGRGFVLTTPPLLFTVKGMAAGKLSAKSQVTIPKKVREAIGVEPGDTVVYEIRGKVALLRKAQPFDSAFHSALSATLDEWASPEDDQAFRDL